MNDSSAAMLSSRDTLHKSLRRLDLLSRAVCGVANPCGSSGYRCGLRLAAHPDPQRRFTTRFIQGIPGRMLSQRGMALIVVLWMLAALSLFAASLGSQVRDRANQALVQRYLVQGRATGEAAIFLALQQVQQQGQRVGVQDMEVSFADQTIAIHLQPWGGLVNINGASENLWAALLIGAAQLSRPQAQVLAQAIVLQRQQKTQDAGEGMWEAPQDLLAVPGMTYAIYASLQPYLVASTDRRNTVAQESAPERLRTWLQAMAPEQLQANGDNGRFYTITAKVPVPDQGTVLVQRGLLLQRHTSMGLPWVLLATTTTWQPVATP